MMDTGNRIKLLRKTYSISQTNFAKELETARTTLASWECGKNTLPPLVAIQIAITYKVGLDWIYLGEMDGDGDVLEKIMKYKLKTENKDI